MRLQFILSEIGNGLRRNKSMAISVVLVTMVSLFFLGSGLLAQRQVDVAKGYWYDKVQVSIFLCTDRSDSRACPDGAVTDAQRTKVHQDLEDLKPLVKKVYHESSAQAYERFKEQFKGSDIVKNVPKDSMPESFRVQLSDPSKYEVVSSAFVGAPGVETVQDQRKLLDKFFTFLNVLSLSAIGLAAVMVVCAVLLIATTIRQTAFSRRKETGIMRLVGASAFVIHLPFVIETLLATLVGAGLAVGLLWGMVHYGISGFLATNISGDLISFIGVGDVWAIAPWLAAGGGVLSILTSWLTLRRYLRV
ncbi:MAG TPA: permease-like cell division protein FtsX [Segeticoccus sp.]|uniref:permease-like cell division protein FtsX n=1 Tax=Segeticoccus sp. TaxID=2706531 RepID=UPI002D80960F|nr:permease-like cell division protein FtsX [Segeticoccus sp.]HET8599936.1 permease-like cell division protein FtsX [Segeticoccus sp.]